MIRPVLYSFRRCPFAIRARLALAASGLHPGADLELREVALKAKPPELLAASPNATVPALVLCGVDNGIGDGIGAGAQGQAPVLTESLAVMQWALERRDPEGWWQRRSTADRAAIQALLVQNDGPFKRHLDRFKYASHYGTAGLAERLQHRQAALVILREWNQRLLHGGWLLGERPSLADWALLPFVRQFRLADPSGFDAEPMLVALQAWLQRFLTGPELRTVMEPPWTARSPWRSPSRLYHLALAGDWQAARADGDYRISTRGRTLAEVGFIHLSHAHQVEPTARRFYGDLPRGELVLLHLERERLAAAGLHVRHEPAPDSGELFPHLHGGALPLSAVLLAEPWQK